MRFLIVVPAYNEEGSIVSTIETIKAAGFDYVIINDGSKDATKDICIAHGYNVVNLPENLGIGGAVQTGHLYAAQHGYDIDIQVDGDGQHDITYVPDLVRAIEDGADLAIGSRFIEKTDGFQSTFMRRVGITWLSGVIGLFFHVKVTDPTSGFRASGPRALALFCEDYPTDYPEPESISNASLHGLNIKEVPVIMKERQSGSSSINAVKSVYYMIKVTLAIVFCRFRKVKGR